MEKYFAPKKPRNTPYNKPSATSSKYTPRVQGAQASSSSRFVPEMAYPRPYAPEPQRIDQLYEAPPRSFHATPNYPRNRLGNVQQVNPYQNDYYNVDTYETEGSYLYEDDYEEYPDINEEYSAVAYYGKENIPPGYFTDKNCKTQNIAVQKPVKIDRPDVGSSFLMEKQSNAPGKCSTQSRAIPRQVENTFQMESTKVLNPKAAKPLTNTFEKKKGITFQKDTPELVPKSRRSTSSRILSGPVEKVLEWGKYSHLHSNFFEVVGILETMRNGKIPSQKIILLRDSETGPALQVTFYEIDRPLQPFKPGTIVKCIGKITDKKCPQVFKVTESSAEEKTAIRHISFMCNRIAHDRK